MLTGKVVSSDDKTIVVARKNSNGSGDATWVYGNAVTRNTWITNTITWDGTTYDFNNGEIRTTNLNTVSLNIFRNISFGYNGGKIKNIKIKPL